MQETNDPHRPSSMNPDDQGLSEELESLYRRVAHSDPSSASDEGHSDTRQHDGENADAGDSSRNGDSYRHPLNAEEFMEKLMTMKAAYEKMLTYWPYSSEYRTQQRE